MTRVVIALCVLVGCAGAPRQREATPEPSPTSSVQHAAAAGAGSRTPEDEFLELETIEPYAPYLERRARHQTKLRVLHASEGEDLAETPARASVVSYRSGELELRGWLVRPDAEGQRPGVVYLHNDFSLTRLSYENALPFADAGFVLFLPALRGENGNPGHFQLLYGEVDDAKAAVAWFAEHPQVRADQIYVIGHSIGGGIAGLLGLQRDLRARHTASIGGMYRAHTFHYWSRRRSLRELVLFDVNDKDEVSLRLLGPNVRDLVIPHTAYAGREDEFDVNYAQHVAGLAQPFGAAYRAVVVDGAHMSSAPAAVQHYIEFIRSDLEAAESGVGDRLVWPERAGASGSGGGVGPNGSRSSRGRL